jgi:hypothetical protein
MIGDRAMAAASSPGFAWVVGVGAIAEAFWFLHSQQRSAWTQELDLRPFSESF